jgi:hypothetical protein
MGKQYKYSDTGEARFFFFSFQKRNIDFARPTHPDGDGRESTGPRDRETERRSSVLFWLRFLGRDHQSGDDGELRN